MIEGVIKKTESEALNTVEPRRQVSVNSDVKQKDSVVNSEDQKKIEHYDVQEAMQRITNVAKMFHRKIHLEIEKDLNIVVVKIIDEDTDKVIRQIPPEELIELSKHAEELKGILIDKEG